MLAFIGNGFYGLLTLEEFSRGEAAFDALRFFILGFDENALYEMIFEQGLEHYLLVIFYPLLNLICCFMMYIETPKTENSVKNIIRVTKLRASSPNSAGGVSLYIGFNKSVTYARGSRHFLLYSDFPNQFFYW